MSQARVTDFFSTRKRSRADETTLSKEKRLKSVETQITTRSRTCKIINNKNEVVINETVKKEDVVVVTPVQEESKENQEVKKKLTAAELKDRMQNFSQKLQKHKAKYAEKAKIEEQKKEEKEQEKIECMIKVQEEINKVCSKKIDEEQTPAYAKYANLASVEYEQKLVLPAKYQNLFELFNGSDTVVKFMHNRQEICTFLKLKTAVQNMTKK